MKKYKKVNHTSTYYLIGICICSLLFPMKDFAKGKGVMRTIQVNVTQTKDFCGGAVPNEEMLKSAQKPHPVIKKYFYVKVGKENSESKPVILKFKTDSIGHASIQLPEGKIYCILEDWKGVPFKVRKDSDVLKWDANCLREEYKKADFILDLTKKETKELNMNFHRRCFYNPLCGQYSGPLPP